MPIVISKKAENKVSNGQVEFFTRAQLDALANSFLLIS
jgi:hypothetical protein